MQSEMRNVPMCRHSSRGCRRNDSTHSLQSEMRKHGNAMRWDCVQRWRKRWGACKLWEGAGYSPRIGSRRGTGRVQLQEGFDHPGLISLNILGHSISMFSYRMLGQHNKATSIHVNISLQTSILNAKSLRYSIINLTHRQTGKYPPAFGRGDSPPPPPPSPLGGGPTPPPFPSQVRRWRDESNDARQYPHGTYALGALYFMQNVTVYYIDRIAQCRRRPPLRPAFEYSMLPWRNK